MKDTNMQSRRLDGMSLDGSKKILRRKRRSKGKPAPLRRGKAIGKAKALPMEEVPGLLTWLECRGRETVSAQLVFALSYYAGLRVAEIAGLTWRDVTDHLGNIADVIRVPAHIAKYGRGRDVPMHPCIASLLRTFGNCYPGAQSFALNANGKPRNHGTLTVWFYRIYDRMGLKGCSSHSGRRSLITYLANNHGKLGMSLKDVQLIAGHRRLESTEAYIEPSSNLHDLVNSVPWAPRGLQLEVTTQLGHPTTGQDRLRPAFAWEHGLERSRALGGRS